MILTSKQVTSPELVPLRIAELPYFAEVRYTFLRTYRSASAAFRPVKGFEGNMKTNQNSIVANTYNHPRGTICSMRSVAGDFVALKIIGRWQEWTGAFSII